MSLDAALEKQLFEARMKLIKQIFELEGGDSSAVYDSPDRRRIHAKFKEELREINKLLGRPGNNDN